MKFMSQRAVVVIINKDKVLLIHRFKNGKEYYVFPGGGIEDGEAAEQAALREAKEETNLDVSLDKKLWEYENEKGRGLEHYFLATKFTGKLQLGGPEVGRQSSKNIYRLEWVLLKRIEELKLFPEAVKEKILDLVKNPEV